jgi:hypothetical protein
MFSDLQAFIESGEAWQQGIYASLYPLPFVMVWSLLARLPFPILATMIVGLSVAILVTLFKRRALLWIGYIPILESLAAGQLSLVWLWLLARSTPLTLALLTLKPHLFPLAIPALIERPALRKPFAVWCAAIYLPAFVARPAWPVEWLTQVFGDGRVTGGTSASLWPVAWLIPLVVVTLCLIHRMNYKTIFTAFNPAMRAYDYTMLAGSSAWLIPASWLALAGMWAVGAAWPMAGVGIVYIIKVKLPCLPVSGVFSLVRSILISPHQQQIALTCGGSDIRRELL